MKNSIIFVLGAAVLILLYVDLHQNRSLKEAAILSREPKPPGVVVETPISTIPENNDKGKDLSEIYKPYLNGRFRREDIAFYSSDLPYKSITLGRTACYGSCPVYSFTIQRDCTATLDAVKFMPKLGQFVGNIDLDTYARLCYALDRFKFLQLETGYLSGITDRPSCIVSVVTASGEMRVVDNGRVGPIELWAIQELLDKVRKDIDWKESATELKEAKTSQAPK